METLLVGNMVMILFWIFMTLIVADFMSCHQTALMSCL